MHLPSPDAAFRELLRIAYSAETQLVITLPRVVERANDPALRNALESHFGETVLQAQRLERLAAAMNFDCGGKLSLAMQGILKEGDELLGYGGNKSLVDAIIVAACRRVEHFEIAAYTTLSTLAGAFDASGGAPAGLIREILDEERRADEKLAEFESNLVGYPATTHG